jgi:asparagine synthase (glutamine-hydrolysing)
MCGIAGLYLPDGAPLADPRLAGMLAAMRHRGPDGIGTHVSRDGRFHGGFARLAIIDIATGGQPLQEDDGRAVFMGNGEVYNYRELRAGLEARGHAFATSGDMEPAFRLWREKGADFVHDLNGMYGIAVYDRDHHSLLLVRDRLGVKPVYWARLAGGGIVFASEIKALFASGLVEPQVDEGAVAAWMGHGYVPAPATLWRGVHKLPQGSLLKAGRDGSVVVETYWRPTAATIPSSRHDIVAHLTELLEDAVRLQLRSDVPLAALLSGGIDSGLLVALAARNLDRPLKTFTVRFAGARVDETPLAEAVAKRWGTDHTTFDLDMGEAARHLPRLAWFCDEPLADASVLPNFLIDQLLAKDTRVVLNGTGGDELFAGYGRYFRLPVEARYLSLPSPLRALAQPLVGLADPMVAWRLKRAAKFDKDPGGYLHDHSTQFPPPIRRLLDCPLAEAGPAQRAYFRAWLGEGQAGALAADIGTYLPEDLLTLLDRTTMAVSVEGRVPFLDHRMVGAALAVPEIVRTPGGRQKALERAMAEPFLPPELLTAPKQGFASPVPAWFAAGLAGEARALLTSPKALARGWWSKAGIERLLARADRHAFRLYALMMLEMTVRVHAELKLAEAPTCTIRELAHA